MADNILITYIRSLFSFDLLIELRESRIRIVSFLDNLEYDEKPLIAIESAGDKSIVKGIGSACTEISDPNIKVINPFSHPRSMVSSFTYAEKIINHAVNELHGLVFQPAPRIVMHQLEKNEGGLTEIEERVLRELAIGAGAREVLVFQGAQINSKIESYDSIKARLKTT